MKRVLSGLMAVLMCGALAGCGSAGKPEGMSNEAYDYGSKGLEVIDQYLATDISAADAKKKLDQIEASISPAAEKSDDVSKDEYVKSNLSFVASLMLSAQNPMRDLGTTIEEIKDCREKLSELLGK